MKNLSFEYLMVMVNKGELTRKSEERFQDGHYLGTNYQFFTLTGKLVAEKWHPTLFSY